MAIKVTLRKRPISKGRQSLYLDFYPAIIHPETGQETRREFLKLYILNRPKTPIEKQSNKETMWIADQIRQKRENQVNKPEVYDEFEKEKLKFKQIGQQSFIEYFEKLADKRGGSNRSGWHSSLKYLKSFNDSLTFADLNEKTANEFKQYLLNTPSNRSKKRKLARNTAVSYFNKFKAALREAYKDGYLQANINENIEPIKEDETQREFLTVDELNKLIETPCNDRLLKNAALFSALTGLRFVDIKNLTWSQIVSFEDGYYIHFKQQKTGGIEYQPISDQAYQLMGEPGNPGEKVFKGLKYSAYQNKHLFQWIGAAGITKNITFHCFRHTFAVLQLANGTDIYTVSKLMGHRDLKTTQVYAKIVDKMKRQAADKIKLNF